MHLHESLSSETLLGEIKNSDIFENLCSALNKDSKWQAVVEIFGEVYPGLHNSEYSREGNPSRKLLSDLYNKLITVGIFAEVLKQSNLFEALSTLLKREPLMITHWSGDKGETVEADLNSALELICEASGNPLPKFTWSRDNQPLDDENTPGHVVTCTFGLSSAESSLQIFNMSPELQGKYFCAITSHTSEVKSGEIDVNMKHFAPVITRQPVNLPRIETQSIVLTCEAYGYPEVEFQWYKENKKLFGEERNTYTKISCTTEDSGTYKCVVSNAAGFVDSLDAIVTVTRRNLLVIEPRERRKVAAKVALLIGNRDKSLNKSINDVALLAQLLSTTGFQVIAFADFDYKDFKWALKMLGNFAKGAYVLFYYAGHGRQFGTDKVIPLVDNELTEKDGETKYKGISVERIKDMLIENGPDARILILDMCLKSYQDEQDIIIKIEEDGGNKSKPDTNYLVAYATSKNLPAYEAPNDLNGVYVKQLAKFISPQCRYTIPDIISEVSRGISDAEVKCKGLEEEKMQIPHIDNNLYKAITFLDEAIGDEKIAKWIKEMSKLPDPCKIEFVNRDEGIKLECILEFSKHKDIFLNIMDVEIKGLNLDEWKVEVVAGEDDKNLSRNVKSTDVPNKFEIRHLEKMRTGIILIINLYNLDNKLVARAEKFIQESLISKVLPWPSDNFKIEMIDLISQN